MASFNTKNLPKDTVDDVFIFSIETEKATTTFGQNKRENKMNINVEDIKNRLTAEQVKSYEEFRERADPNNFHTEGVLLRYIALCKFNVQDALSVKEKLEEYYQNLSKIVSDEELIEEIKSNKYKFSELKDGRRVVHLDFKFHIPNAQKIESTLKLFLMLMDILLEEWEIIEKGFTIVCWMEGSGWANFDFQGQLKSIEMIKSFLPFSANMFGKCILVDSPWYVRLAMNIMKPFVPANIYEKHLLCNSDQIGDHLSIEELTKTDIFSDRVVSGLYSRWI